MRYAYLRWPATVVTVFWVLCIQVVIVSTWKLLTLVKNDRIFTNASLVWVNAIVWAIAAAWACCFTSASTRTTPDYPSCCS
jgi:acyl-coenzyme A synthetase/AMP-(fatty) acid ligase